MKKSIFLSLFLFIFCYSVAQDYAIEQSPSFSEPREGHLRLIQLENDYTVFLHFEQPMTAHMRIYNESRKLTVNKTIELPFLWRKSKRRRKEKRMMPPEVFAVGNDVVIFGGTFKERQPAINRFVFDGTTGQQKEKKLVAVLEGVSNMRSVGNAWGQAFGGVPLPRFFVRHEPVSDHYVISVLNSQHPDRENKGIEIIHYNNNHKEVGRAYYKSPNPEFKFLELIDVSFAEDQKLVGMAYVFDKRGHEKNYNVIFSLAKDASTIKIKKFNHPKVDRFNTGILQYNEKSEVLAFMGLKNESRRGNTSIYSSHFIIIDPMELEILFLKDITAPDVQDQYKEMFGDKEEFTGIPQDFSIDEEGNYMIVFEEMSSQTTKYGTLTKLGHGAVAILDNKLVEKEQYILPKSHMVQASYPPTYLSNNNYKPEHMYQSNLYKSISYINSINGRYVFFNDVEKNVKKIKEGKNKLTTIRGVGDCNAYVLNLENGKSKRNLLFEESPKTNKLGLFRVWNYNAETSTLATIRLNIGKEKESRVVWIKL